MINKTDRDPLDIFSRRVRALLNDLNKKKDFSPFAKFDAELKKLEAETKRIKLEDRKTRFATFAKVAALRKQIAFANPGL